ncbi:MAG: hypothetical protein KDK66_04750 [Deltaproteobacteria bacterium]|nr:hypothetical protein [Deltaproteobacteria bacterium]
MAPLNKTLRFFKQKALVLALVLGFSLAACGLGTETGNSPSGVSCMVSFQTQATTTSQDLSEVGSVFCDKPFMCGTGIGVESCELSLLESASTVLPQLLGLDTLGYTTVDEIETGLSNQSLTIDLKLLEGCQSQLELLNCSELEGTSLSQAATWDWLPEECLLVIEKVGEENTPPLIHPSGDSAC